MNSNTETYKCAICGNKFGYEEFVSHCKFHFKDDVTLQTKLFALGKRIQYPIRCKFANCKSIVMLNPAKSEVESNVCDTCMYENKYRRLRLKTEISEEEYNKLKTELINELNSKITR